MIVYSHITLKQVIDEVIIRIGNHRTNINIDWETLVKYVNYALAEIITYTMELKEWANTLLMSCVMSGDIMPIGTLRVIRVYLSEDGITNLKEARKISVREHYTINDVDTAHSWNMSMKQQPTYMLWAEANIMGASQLKIHFNPIDYIGKVEINCIPDEVYLDTHYIPIPHEYIELLILSIMTRIYAYTAEYDMLGKMHERMGVERMKIIKLEREKETIEKRNLDSFVMPTIPFMMQAPQEGEVQKRLVI